MSPSPLMLLILAISFVPQGFAASLFPDPVSEVGVIPRGIAVDDFNADGIEDMAVANSGDPVAGIPGDLPILLGNGDRTFAPEICLDPGRGGPHVQVGLVSGAESDPPVPMDRVVAAELKILGTHGMQAHRYGAVLRMVLSGRLQPGKLIGKRVPLDSAPAELEAMTRFGAAGITVIDRFDGTYIRRMTGQNRSGSPPDIEELCKLLDHPEEVENAWRCCRCRRCRRNRQGDQGVRGHRPSRFVQFHANPEPTERATCCPRALRVLGQEISVLDELQRARLLCPILGSLAASWDL